MLLKRRMSVFLLALLLVAAAAQDDSIDTEAEGNTTALAPVTDAISLGSDCKKDVCVRVDESENALGPGKCSSHCDCDGARLCLPSGTCSGVLVDNSTVCTDGVTTGCQPAHGWTVAPDFKNSTDRESVLLPRCALCPGGTFSPGGSPAEETLCRPCGDNQASPEGSTDEDACFNCPRGQVPLQFGNAPNTSCACTLGSTWNGTACKPCPPGTRFSVPANFTPETALRAPTCRACGGNTVSEVPNGGALSCVACDVFSNPQSSLANTRRTKCVCQPGFFGPATLDRAGRLLCDACPPGTYNNKTDATACTPCANGTVSTSGALKCTACKAPLVAFRGRVCVCPSGQQPDISGDRCSPCPPFLVSRTGASSCTPCPAGLVPFNATSCVCPAGTEPDVDGRCSPCRLGLYKVKDSNSSCAACPEGTFQNITGTGCTKCDTRSAEIAPDRESCVCRPGYYGPVIVNVKGRPACTACPAGTFSTDGVALNCTACPAGSVAPRASNSSLACTPCPRGRVPYGGSSCVCPAGTEPTRTGGCARCKRGWVKSKDSNSSCVECDAEISFANTNATLCVKCDSRSAQISEDGRSCVCRPGYYGPLTPNEKGRPACLPCDAGSYNEDGLGDKCTPCPDGGVGPRASNSSDACRVCPADRVPLTGSSCVCPPGTEPDANDRCRPCARGTVKSKVSNATCAECREGTFPNANATACVRCDNRTTLINSAGTACVCRGGHIGPLEENSRGRLACTPCPGGTYNVDGSGTTCTPCPNGATSPPGTSSPASCFRCPDTLAVDTRGRCVCTLGFEPRQGSAFCSPCRPGSYKSKDSNSTCVDCPDGKYTNDIGAKACRKCAGSVNSARTACLA